MKKSKVTLSGTIVTALSERRAFECKKTLFSGEMDA
jgi:hypothetical protein